MKEHKSVFANFAPDGLNSIIDEINKNASKEEALLFEDVVKELATSLGDVANVVKVSFEDGKLHIRNLDEDDLDGSIEEDFIDDEEEDNVDTSVEDEDDIVISFIDFLKKNDAYDKYMKNIKPENQGIAPYTKYYTIDKIKNINNEYWVSRGFNWGESPEGFEFWLNLDKEWCNIVSSLKYKIIWGIDTKDEKDSIKPEEPKSEVSFIDFLKENDAYDKYMKNIRPENQNSNPYVEYLTIDKIKDVNKIYWISRGFSWTESPEGSKFWNRLNNKWEMIIINPKTKIVWDKSEETETDEETEEECCTGPITKVIFCNFLKLNGAYDKYIEAFHKGVDFLGYNLKDIKATPPEYWVAVAFNWRSNSKFWSEIHNKWLTLIHDIDDENVIWCIDAKDEKDFIKPEITKKEVFFCDFLKEHNAYDKYMKNIKVENQRWCVLLSYVDPYEIKNLLSSNWIIRAFNWDNSPEGYDFWKILQDKWENIITDSTNEISWCHDTIGIIDDIINDEEETKEESDSKIISFTNFLKENNAYDKYIENSKIENQRWVYLISYREPSNIKDTPTDRWITCAFNWDNSPEGYDFWKRLDKKWSSIIDETENEIIWDEDIKDDSNNKSDEKESDDKQIVFIDFLKENDVYDKYMENIKIENQRWANIESYKEPYKIKELYIDEWVSGFKWDSSPEGYDFWADISNKWNDVIELVDNKNIVWEKEK